MRMIEPMTIGDIVAKLYLFGIHTKLFVFLLYVTIPTKYKGLYNVIHNYICMRPCPLDMDKEGKKPHRWEK